MLCPPSKLPKGSYHRIAPPLLAPKQPKWLC